MKIKFVWNTAGSVPGVLLERVQRSFWNPYSILDLNNWFSLPYFRPEPNTNGKGSRASVQNLTGFQIQTLNSIPHFGPKGVKMTPKGVISFGTAQSYIGYIRAYPLELCRYSLDLYKYIAYPGLVLWFVRTVLLHNHWKTATRCFNHFSHVQNSQISVCCLVGALSEKASKREDKHSTFSSRDWLRSRTPVWIPPWGGGGVLPYMGYIGTVFPRIIAVPLLIASLE